MLMTSLSKTWPFIKSVHCPCPIASNNFSTTAPLFTHTFMAGQLLSTGQKHESLPVNYIRPEAERPRLAEVQEDHNIPVIDLSQPDKALIIQQVAHACQSYGFFQVQYIRIPSSSTYSVYAKSRPADLTGCKSWSVNWIDAENYGNRRRILPAAGRGEDEPLFRRPSEENEAVDELQCKEGEGSQLERLSPASLLPAWRVCAWLAFKASAVPVKFLVFILIFSWETNTIIWHVAVA